MVYRNRLKLVTITLGHATNPTMVKYHPLCTEMQSRTKLKTRLGLGTVLWGIV